MGYALSGRLRSSCRCAAVLLAACGGAEPEAGRTAVASAGVLTIYDACAPASPAADVGSLYFIVENAGTTEDTLLRVVVPGGNARLHEVMIEAGTTHMQPLAALPIPPGRSIALVPGSYHVMLSDLATPLRAGDSLHVSVEFARAGAVRFTAGVLTYTEIARRFEREDGSQR